MSEVDSRNVITAIQDRIHAYHNKYQQVNKNDCIIQRLIDDVIPTGAKRLRSLVRLKTIEILSVMYKSGVGSKGRSARALIAAAVYIAASEYNQLASKRYIWDTVKEKSNVSEHALERAFTQFDILLNKARNAGLTRP